MGNNTEKWWDNATQKGYYDILVNSEDPEATMEQWSSYYKYDPNEQENWSKAWAAYTSTQHETAGATGDNTGGGEPVVDGDNTGGDATGDNTGGVAGGNSGGGVTGGGGNTGRDVGGNSGGGVTGGGSDTGGDTGGDNTGSNGGSKTLYEVDPGIKKAADEGDTIVKEAAEALLNRLNTKFQYSATGSPLYGILREQYEREAERASGRAYARATANAGGYGSSYATLAGEEAARQVMEGFDDNQMALYEAARAEYEAETQSLSDRYTLALREQQRRNAALAEEEARVAELNEDAELTATTGMNKDARAAYSQVLASSLWTGSNPETVSSYLTNEGYDEETVGQVIAALERNAKAIAKDQDTYRAGLTEPQQEIYDIASYLYTEAGGDYDKFMEEFGKKSVYRYPEWKQEDVDKALRTFFDKHSDEKQLKTGDPTEQKLTETQTEIVDIIYNSRAADLGDTNIRKQLTTAYGYSEADVDAAFNAIRGFEKAQIQDEVGAWKKNPTLEGVVSLAQRATEVGDTEAVKEILDIAFAMAIDDPETAYTILGVSEEEWSGMSTEDKIEKISDSARTEWQAGRISTNKYVDVLLCELDYDLECVHSGSVSGSDTKQGRRNMLLDLVAGLTNAENEGIIPSGQNQEGIPYSQLFFKKIIESKAFEDHETELQTDFENYTWLLEHGSMEELMCLVGYMTQSDRDALARLMTFKTFSDMGQM